MANWGPVTVGIGPGATTPDSQRAMIFDSGTFVPGQLLRVGGQCSVTFQGGKNDAVWDIHVSSFAANGDFIDNQVNLIQFRLTTLSANFNYTVPLGATHVQLFFRSALYQGQTETCTASGTTDTQGFCQFGTRLKVGGQATIILTQSLIETALATAGLPWLAAVMSPIYGLALDAARVCAQGPQQLPAVNTDLFNAAPDVLLQVFEVVTWNNFCECVPGTPVPVPYPPSQPVQPTSWPAAPAFPCDPADLCSSISEIKARLNALSGSLAQVAQLVTLMQRYRLPFAYIPGATHSSLTGEGGFQVSRLVGLRAEITARPPDAVALKGNPPYLIDMGWLSVTDPNGMLEEKRLTRDDQLWFPQNMAAAASFNWSLFPDVTIRVTELEAEP